MPSLQEKLKQVPDERMPILSQIPLKNPIIGLILGICFGFFAVDRFYKGDIGLGIAKLFLGIFTLYIWNIFNLFLVWRGIKKDNLQRIQNVLYLP